MGKKVLKILKNIKTIIKLFFRGNSNLLFKQLISMTPHEFHEKFADTPVVDRLTILNFHKYGDLTLNKLFDEVKDLQDKIRPYQVQLDWLMKIADEYYIFKSQN